MNEKAQGGEVHEAETEGFNHKGWLASVAGREHKGFRLCQDAVPLPKALSAFTSDDLSMNEAIQIAQSVACQKRNISVTDIADETIKASFVLLDNGQTAWVVTLFDDAFQDPTVFPY